MNQGRLDNSVTACVLLGVLHKHKSDLLGLQYVIGTGRRSWLPDKLVFQTVQLDSCCVTVYR